VVAVNDRRGRVGTVTLVLALAGLLVGAAIAPTVWDATSGPDGQVAVIEVEGTITGTLASSVVADLREARQNDSIGAVVLDVNSPGGTASASEQLYLAVKRTSETMPVVASVTGTAASGAYYTVAPADEIYVTPASVVGSVGVRAVVPSEGTPPGEIVTGPDKGTTGTEEEVRQRVETLRRAFVGSVFAERGEGLSLTREELSYAKVYSGARSTQLGLADSVGGIDSAVSTAAADAGLDTYGVVRYEAPQVSLLSQLGLGSINVAGTQVGIDADAGAFSYHGVDTTRYLMIHGQVDTTEEVTVNVSA
jgi:protease-4